MLKQSDFFNFITSGLYPSNVAFKYPIEKGLQGFSERRYPDRIQWHITVAKYL